MERNEEQRKYRNLNRDYLTAVENVRRNREEARRIVNERKALDNILWDANECLNAASETDDPYRREMAVRDAQEEVERAAAAIRKKNEQYEAMKRELEEYKKEIASLLNRLKSDRQASRLIDAALLTRLNRELDIKRQGLANTTNFYDKLGMILNTLSGVGSFSEEDLDIRREYDVTMKTITSLSDMIEYYEEREALLLKETITDESETAERSKTEQEMAADITRAQEILEEELRPKRIERTKNREKLLAIISTQAHKVDLDPRDMDGILTVEQMREKREALASEIRSMKDETEAFAQLVRRFERKTMLSGGNLLMSFIPRIIKELKAATPSPEEDEAADSDEPEEERFISRYRIAHRELNRRYNQIMGVKDAITEQAYSEDDE